MFKTSKRSHGTKPTGRLVSTEEVLPDIRSLAPMVDGPAMRNRQRPSGFSPLKAVLGLFVTFAASLSAEAGDILRGGYSAQHQNSTGSVSSAGVVPSLQSNSGGQDRLARTTQALQSVQQMQAAARQAAQNAGNKLNSTLPNVPNGLAPGGLQVATGTGGKPVLWQGATLPTQTTSGSQTTVTVKQTSPDALLNWQTFNVGKSTTLNFDQSKGGSDASKWIVFNEINDPSTKPSQILGSIQAQGHVYVINPNGIIFGGSSQVNVHTLVASALPIDNGLVSRGLLNNPDAHFLFSALPQPVGTNGTPAFTPQVSDAPFTVTTGSPSYTLSQIVETSTTPVLTAVSGSSAPIALVAGTDYTLSTTSSGGKTIVTFTTTGLAKVTGAQITASYTSASVRYGDVVVQSGAQISSPTSAAHVGGRVALIGANVTNDGTISTPDGQTILAAGLQVGLAAHPSADPTLRGLDVYVGKVTDPLSVLKRYAGTATNNGLIEAPRADVTIAGKNVNQMGFVDSSTSVTLNGRIDLLADYNATSNPAYNPVTNPGVPPFFSGTTGAVTFGANSVTQILPELSSTQTVVGTQLALPSLVNVQGLTIHFATDSTLLAPNASLPTPDSSNSNAALDAAGAKLVAGISLTAGNWKPGGVQTQLVATGGQIYLDSGASIDASGSANVPVPISENIIALQLLGTQLADSPLQRAGLLRGMTIQVDLRQTGVYDGFGWVGTPLADASGYVGLIQRSVGELTTAGGTVSLIAGNSVVMQQGSQVNVSGGSIAYQGGMVQTTRLISDGQIFDISQATPDRVYQGVYTGSFTTTSPKYGLTDTYISSLLLNGAHYEAGYIQGANGGSISITAPSMALDGSLLGNTTSGPRQRSLTSTSAGASIPTPSSLTLQFQAQRQDPFNAATYLTYSPTPPDVVFEQGASLTSADPFAVDSDGNPLPLSKERQSTVILSPNLVSTSGFGSLTINNSDGSISVPANVSITTAAGGSIAFKAASIDIEGKIAAPGGALTFRVTDLSPYSQYFYEPVHNTIPGIDLSRGQFILGSGASLSTAGLLVDDRAGAPQPGVLPLVTDGGTITIKSFSAALQAGSTIDASGGVAVSAAGKQTYGKGGKIDIEAGQDQQVDSSDPTSVAANNDGFIVGGTLVLKSKLTAFSGTHGGTLSILAPSVQIGGVPTDPATLYLSPDFFSTGGFSTFNISGLGAKTDITDQYLPGVYIAPGTAISPIVENTVAVSTGPGIGTLALSPTLLPVAQRTPVSLNFSAPGVRDALGTVSVRGDVVLGAGSLIQTDPLGSVSMTGDTATVLGSIIVPGGTISIAGGKNSSLLFRDAGNPLATVEIGPDAVLSTAGTTVLTADPRGYRIGSVLAGGTIKLSGNVVAEAGAVLDVSGATDMLDMRPTYSSSSAVDGSSPESVALVGTFLGYPMVPTRVDSNAGSIVLAGSQELFSDATLIGKSGGPSAAGGSLSVSSGIFIAPTSTKAQSPLDPTLVVTQSGPVIPVDPASATQSVIGSAIRDSKGNVIAGLGHIAVSSFADGGFDNISLAGTVKFAGPVSITANRVLTVAANGGGSNINGGGIIYANGPVTLAAPYVQIGLPFVTPGTPSSISGNYAPSHGTGSLTVEGSLIDIGNLSLQGIGNASFLAPNGDIRGDGTLDVQGHITLEAGQIYPPTAVTFTIAAYDWTSQGKTHPGSVTILSSGSRELPMSAGGTLNIYGTIIDQSGVLRAPIGTINLGWDGSGKAPVDPIVGTLLSMSKTQQLTLSSGSITSVSAVDPSTGTALLIPYGLNENGTSWIDPTGADITSNGGAPRKTVTISAANIVDQKGATIDLSGGGDLFAYRFVSGVGGTNDILGSASGTWSKGATYSANTIVLYNGSLWSARQTSTGVTPAAGAYWTQLSQSFAVIPGYQANYAPYAAYNSQPSTTFLGSDSGYTSNGLSVGDQVYLNSTNGLAAGVYTLLPARYALLPGAFLVTPQAGSIPVGTQILPDGSNLASGYRFNSLNPAQSGQPLLTRFEIDSSTVIQARAQYDGYSAGTFLSQAAASHGTAVPRLPIDGGQLIFDASQTLVLRGAVLGQAATGGQGSLIDISSTSDIVISGPGTTAKAGQLVLDSSELSSFGAESLLIGGIRTFGPNGTTVSVETKNITVDNAGSPLTGSDIILVANQNLTVAAGAQIESAGSVTGQAETLLLGSTSQPGSGNGTLLRVSSDPTAQIFRTGVDSSTTPAMAIGNGARISGQSVTLDSTYATSLSSTTILTGTDINLNSGQISIQLNNPGSLQPTAGLVLTNGALQTMEAGAQSLALLSYTSIDVYGDGQVGTASLGNLALHAAEIRGFNSNGGTATFAAQNILLDNAVNGKAPGAIATPDGTLAFRASTIELGTNALAIDQFNTVAFFANGGLLFKGSGALTVQGDLTVTAPVITGTKGAVQTITAGGGIQLTASSTPASVSGGLGASLTMISGANSGFVSPTGLIGINDNGRIALPSGSVSLEAKTGDLTIGGRVDVSGMAKQFNDLIEYTDGGTINLTSDQGSVIVDGSLSVSAPGGNAGTLAISTPNGVFTINPKALVQGTGGFGGTFTLDAGSLPGGSLASLDTALNKGGFVQSISIRDRSDTTVFVDGNVTAHHFNVSADQGSIEVASGVTIDASGATGGSISLEAAGSVTLDSGSLLTVAATDGFSSAGKGGSVSLEAGAYVNGTINTGATVDIAQGSTIDLSVSTTEIDPVTHKAVQVHLASDATLGHFTGTLHIRAPQISGASGRDLQVSEIDGKIIDASNVVIEGYQVYDLSGTNNSVSTSGAITHIGSSGTITSTVTGNVSSNGAAFAGNTANILSRLLQNYATLNGAPPPTFVVETGAEIVNNAGNLTLATDWDLHTFRFGPSNAPGVLTLRASGNLVFNATLSDGFTTSKYNAGLMTMNAALPANAQSWSYRLVAGADLSAADFHQVQSLAALNISNPNTDYGSLQLGVYGTGSAPANRQGAGALTSDAIAGHYQVIRTGSGDIDIATARNVELRNQFATIYTAGTQISAPVLSTTGGVTTIQLAGGQFDLPVAKATGQSATNGLGVIQNLWTPQYSLGGGNVTITAGQDILHQALSNGTSGTVIDDSESQMPMNWLYRRSYVDQTGLFGTSALNDVASTTWWIDFSNFFEGVGALGGGNVSLIAGRDVKNVDAVAPTNALMIGKDSNGNRIAPNASNLMELGGGNVLVQAGRNINAGVYYVERGQGTLSAGAQITTNSTRSAANKDTQAIGVTDPSTWLPTTLFLGKGSFDVTARGNIQLGPVANPFLLPEGIGNVFWYKTYFSTYAPTDSVNVTSLGGSVTLKESSIDPSNQSVTPILQAWLRDVLLLNTTAGARSVSYDHPWLRLDETSVDSFGTVAALMPPTLQVTAFSGDISLIGNLTLSPASNGTINLAAAGSIVGFNQIGHNLNGDSVFQASTINLSDASPAGLPGITTPIAYQAFAGKSITQAIRSGFDPFATVDSFFAESGSSLGAYGVLQTQQALHGSSLLHANDSDPIHVYAQSGDISGVTLYSAKSARVVAGQDLTDIALYIQNDNSSDISIVSAGRDILAFDPSSPLRSAASSFDIPDPLAGDIQISGPGTLEVLAGRNIDLGEGRNSSAPSDTNVGITSIGNARNPNLPFDGASVVVGAGIGPAGGLAQSQLDFSNFIGEFASSSTGSRYLTELAAMQSSTPGVSQSLTADGIANLPAEQRDLLALQLFYLVLRDAGRDHSDPTSTGFGNYAAGFSAIAALFPEAGTGDFSLSSRNLLTKSGGNISVFAPGGELSLGNIVQNPPPGIVTQDGGSISIFTQGNVDVGVERIFTLRGGDEIIWSSGGNIAAGASSKTVQTAPPTRVLVDPQSADIETDLAGLATGGGIGVLATVAGVAPGNVDLIAPTGTIDAGDAGIRATGNLNISAVQVLNASNIQVGGTSSGVPATPTVAAPNLGGLAAASNATGATANSADQVAKQQPQNQQQTEEAPSLYTVEVVGYGGGEGSTDAQ